MNHRGIMAKDRRKCGPGAICRPCIWPSGCWVKTFVCHRQTVLPALSHIFKSLSFSVSKVLTLKKKERLPQEWVIKYWNSGEVHILDDWQFMKWHLVIKWFLSNFVNWEWHRTWGSLDVSIVCVVPSLYVRWHSFYASPMESLLVSVYL